MRQVCSGGQPQAVCQRCHSAAYCMLSTSNIRRQQYGRQDPEDLLLHTCSRSIPGFGPLAAYPSSCSAWTQQALLRLLPGSGQVRLRGQDQQPGGGFVLPYVLAKCVGRYATGWVLSSHVRNFDGVLRGRIHGGVHSVAGSLLEGSFSSTWRPPPPTWRIYWCLALSASWWRMEMRTVNCSM